MSNKKISELPPGNANLDSVLPSTDPSTLTTSKITIQQIIDFSPIKNVSGKTGQVLLDKSDVDLNNVDNTSDLDKPISTATQESLDLKANISDLGISNLAAGRLTLVSGSPVYVPGSSIVMSSFLFYSPYKGNKIGLYDIPSDSWKTYEFNQLSLNLSGLPGNANFDIFLYMSNNTLKMESVQWSNNSTRSISLFSKDGVFVKSTSLNKRYLGTIRTTSSGFCEESSSRSLVWNYNNRISRKVECVISTSHTYNSSSFRPYNNNTIFGQGRCDLLIGVLEDNAFISIKGNLINGNIGVGNDSNIPGYGLFLGSSGDITGGSSHVLYPKWGYQYFQMLQWTTSGVGTYNDMALSISLLS